jgi:hypothetical protein
MSKNRQYVHQVTKKVDQQAEILAKDPNTKDFTTAGAIVVGFDGSDPNATTQSIECKCVSKGTGETSFGYEPVAELDKWQQQKGISIGAVFYTATSEGVSTDHEFFEDEDQWTETVETQEKKFGKQGEQQFKHLADMT